MAYGGKPQSYNTTHKSWLRQATLQLRFALTYQACKGTTGG